MTGMSPRGAKVVAVQYLAAAVSCVLDLVWLTPVARDLYERLGGGPAGGRASAVDLA